jgi:excinuclease UvrABC helicase subunit UvrB
MKKTAKYYQENPKARAKKDSYNKEYNKKPSAVKKRVEANRANRKSQAAGLTTKNDGKDYDHAVKRFVSATINRGRAEKSRLKGSTRSL